MDTMMLILNTIYFKANWSKKFDKKSTTKMDFVGGKQVDMMRQVEKFNYYEDDNVQIVQMGYVGDDFSMVIILPKSNLDLVGLNKVLKPEYFNLTKSASKRVDLYMPKFTQRSKMGLIPNLQKLGVNDLFNNADLSLIGDKIFVSAIIHEAVVIVDEEGTEAAAVTAITVTLRSAPKLTLFKADHPFIYYIKHNKSNLILFIVT